MNENIHFHKLYTDHSKMVFNLCLNYLHNTEDAEEATQDVFIKVHDKIAGFRAESSVKHGSIELQLRIV